MVSSMRKYKKMVFFAIRLLLSDVLDILLSGLYECCKFVVNIVSVCLRLTVTEALFSVRISAR